MSKISELLPDFVAAAQASLQAQGHPELAQQLTTLNLSSWTHDPEADAAYLYLSGQTSLNVVEKNIIGIRHGESIELAGLDGIIVVDTDNFNRLTGIEILSRDDLVKQLKRACAPNNSMHGTSQ